MGYKVPSAEFMHPLSYPNTTGYIEFVGVLEKARGKGVAAEMLKAVVAHHTQYSEFVLDVTDVNISAQKCYERFGFREFERVPEKYGKFKGFE